MSNAIISGRVKLIGGMYERKNWRDEPSQAFGLATGQMRPTDHNCQMCGFNENWGRRLEGPTSPDMHAKGRSGVFAYCECPGISRMPKCIKLTHNSSWYNDKGEKMGWGDLCICDIERIGKEAASPFYILPESCFWDWRQGAAQISESNPGITLVREKVLMVVVPPHENFVGSTVYSIDHFRERGRAEPFSYDRLPMVRIAHADMKDFGI